ncbi:MAG TPA: MCE family protein [Mycobacterium sp.]|nr:MCE family protein [Mycobacterium sp.]
MHPAWWTLIMIAVLVAVCLVTAGLFAGTFRSYVPVTLTSERTGLVMDSGGKVKMRGVEVGRVSGVESGRPTSLRLQIYPDQIEHIPANVGAQIRATTVFGAKYIDLIYPANPSARPLTAGSVIASQNVSTEVNTVFENLVDVLDRIDPAKLNGVLSALGEGLRGMGTAMGEAVTDANQVLLELNPRADAVRADWRSLRGFSATYGAAAQDILTVLDAASTTATTVTAQADDLDTLLTSVIGFARSGIDLIGPHRGNLVDAINALEPTTRLLMTYNPSLTCMLVGAKWFLDNGGYAAAGGSNGKSTILDSAVLLGDDAYRYPDNLPINGAKGGPDGKPGCGSLPIVDNNWPQRQLITNTGWGTGLDTRPNPGIGFPGYSNYFPVTRAQPEPPSVRDLGGGPAPGPAAPPGSPPQHIPGTPPQNPDIAPVPGAEPFRPPVPAQMQPTPLPPAPPEPDTPAP